jgi:hypothetical protein
MTFPLTRRSRCLGAAVLAAGAAGAACAPVSSPRSSAPVAAAIEPPRWRAGFERGDLSEWTYLLDPRGLSVVDGPAAVGRRAGRVEILPTDLWPNGLNRVEVQHKPPPETMAEGQRSCFAWRFLVPVALSDDRHQIGYWESYPSYRQIMSFEVRGRAIAFVTRLPEERVQWQAAGLVTPGAWHQVALCARWSVDPARGAVNVWFDGRRVVTAGRARTLWDNPNLVQLGILRDRAAAPAEILYLDDALEGPSLDAAGISGAAADGG